MLKLKLQYFGHLMQSTDSPEKMEKRTTENEMVGWQQQLNEQDFEQGLGAGEGREA